MNDSNELPRVSAPRKLLDIPVALPAINIETNAMGGLVVVTRDVPHAMRLHYDPQKQNWILTMELKQ